MKLNDRLYIVKWGPLFMVALLLFACNNKSNKEENVYLAAEKSAIYMNIDMNKSFSETLSFIQNMDSAKDVTTGGSYVEDKITELINIHEVDSTIIFDGEITLQNAKSEFETLETHCEAHFKDSIFYFLQARIYCGSDDERISLLYDLYQNKYGKYNIKETASEYRMDMIYYSDGIFDDYAYLHARLRTHYDVIGWNFPDLYLYIEKSWDDEKYWYADEENLEYAVESVMGFRGYYDIEYPHLNRVLEKVYIDKVEEKTSSYALTIYYVNKDVQNYFDELKRKERLEKVQELERYNDSLSNAENATHKISMEKFKNQSI